MKQLFSRTTVTILIFAVAIISAFIAPYLPWWNKVKYIVLSASLIYIFLGWYLFQGYHPTGHIGLLVLTGYLYSCVFMSLVFSIFEWPFAQMLLSVSFFWIAGLIVLIIVLRKKMPLRGFTQFLIEAGLMLGLVVLNIFKYF
jgi:hypothetical protein